MVCSDDSAGQIPTGSGGPGLHSNGTYSNRSLRCRVTIPRNSPPSSMNGEAKPALDILSRRSPEVFKHRNKAPTRQLAVVQYEARYLLEGSLICFLIRRFWLRGVENGSSRERLSPRTLYTVIRSTRSPTVGSHPADRIPFASSAAAPRTIPPLPWIQRKD